MTTTPRVALVTGATQGLGLALVGELARRLEPHDVVYLTGRNGAKVKELAGTFSGSPGATVVPEHFDVAEADSAERVAALLQDRHGGVDIVFNNAVMRVRPNDDASAVVGEYVEVNNLATTRVLRAFGQIVRDHGRLIVVASSLGTLDYLAPVLHPVFRDLHTLNEVDHAITAWRDQVVSGEVLGSPWPGFINIPSKIGQVAAVRALAEARHDADLVRGILLAAVCPGMMNTPTSEAFWDVADAPTPEHAAAPLVNLALGPADPELYGELSRDGRVLTFDPLRTPAQSRPNHP
ncbi:SDR family NAD(P)-dependent oxidoreductase [Promicromonospora sukumoe]|uniref:NAD(P)-dependent dehydrogenase (Short-subunit alcohol dehydrogenase family) n=1 Tax=Promicromonospora sukumoe TaxID=88382 RepID=A0A7W3J7D9_9MICO|nr:SDR family NAD(P)-dependent oxidoreductase [Promicromonospora sukumoe]MBA8807681.1 NAD(P)-dependent dehydrogenase (short-subunit alcohol dehydrogenase family) [Promicromonospora sukumoe]